MNFLKMLKQVIRPGVDLSLLVKFREMILIIDPQTTATIKVPKGASLTVTGYAGVLWITAEGCPNDYKIKNGETVKIAGGGKVVIQALTTHVPCRLHVVYQPSLPTVH